MGEETRMWRWAVDGHWGPLAGGLAYSKGKALFELNRAVRHYGRAAVYAAGIMQRSGMAWLPVGEGSIWSPVWPGANTEYRAEADPTEEALQRWLDGQDASGGAGDSWRLRFGGRQCMKAGNGAPVAQLDRAAVS